MVRATHALAPYKSSDHTPINHRLLAIGFRLDSFSEMSNRFLL